jgi:hypothetical protein
VRRRDRARFAVSWPAARITLGTSGLEIGPRGLLRFIFGGPWAIPYDRINEVERLFGSPDTGTVPTASTGTWALLSARSGCSLASARSRKPFARRSRHRPRESISLWVVSWSSAPELEPFCMSCPRSRERITRRIGPRPFHTCAPARSNVTDRRVARHRSAAPQVARSSTSRPSQARAQPPARDPHRRVR